MTESRLSLFRKSALTGRGRAPEAGLTRQVPAEARSNYGKNLMTKGYS